MAESTDPSDIVYDAINDFFSQFYTFISTIITRFTSNIRESFAQVPKGRWTKVILSVVFYIVIRPYIEKFFRWSSEKERKRREEKEKEEKEATGHEAGRKAKVSANSLRGGAATAAGAADESGKVLGEVDNTDDELDDDEEGEDIKFAKASGVPEWGKNARKRQKKQARNTHNLTDEQLLGLLDWSESEDEKK